MTIGQSIPRLEDRRFLTGQGCFTDDLQFANALHAVVDVPAALAADAPSVWDDVPGNRCVTWRQGDTAAVDAAFAAAAHVVSLTVHNNRQEIDSKFQWDAQTGMSFNKKPISAGDLKVGQFLMVSYVSENNVNKAQRISVRTPFKKSQP